MSRQRISVATSEMRATIVETRDRSCRCGTGPRRRYAFFGVPGKSALASRSAVRETLTPSVSSPQIPNIIAAALTALALGAAPAAAQKITFTLNWVAGGDHAPYFYAQKMGSYKQ